MALEAALQALGGGSSGPVWQGVRSYGTPDAILAGLSKVESSGNPYALNKDSKALGEYQFTPETLVALHKEGVKFNPLDPVEARAAADFHYQQKLVRAGGDQNKALAAYGGFKTKDPSGYIAKVTGAAPQAAANEPLSGALQALTETQAQTAQAKVSPTLSGSGKLQTAMKESPFSKESVKASMDSMGSDLGAAVINQVTGLGAGIVSGYRGISELVQGNSLDDAVRAIRSQQESGTYQPETKGGQVAAKVMSLPGQAVGWMGKKLGEASQDEGASPGVATALETGLVGASLLAGAKGLNRPVTLPTLPGGMLTDPAKIAALQTAKQPFGSVGSSATSNNAAVQATLSTASPELQAGISQQLKGAPGVNAEALARQVQADQLPVPIRLTKGQATQDPLQISFEQNNRGKMPEFAQRFNAQSPQLHENLTAIRDKVAPDVFAVRPIENAESIIKSYQVKDAVLSTDISAKYKALKDANGGTFPVDGKAFAVSAEAQLAKDLKTDFVPSAIQKQLDRFKEGEPMSFEQFEAMRTNLAAEIRKAQRSGDGNAAYASGIVRDALENLPLTPEAAALKPIADTARSAAKARFDLLRKDPAYKAAVDDVRPDTFVQKFIIGADPRNIPTMIKNLGEGTPAHQAMAAAAINYLKERAGTEANNFSQAGYNRALNGLTDKLPALVGQEATRQLQAVGEVARNTTFQPRGSFVNNSNTLTGALAEHAKNIAEWGANKAGFGGLIPIGSMIRGGMARRAANQAMTEALQTGAGVALKDIGRK